MHTIIAPQTCYQPGTKASLLNIRAYNIKLILTTPREFEKETDGDRLAVTTADEPELEVMKTKAKTLTDNTKNT